MRAWGKNMPEGLARIQVVIQDSSNRAGNVDHLQEYRWAVPCFSRMPGLARSLRQAGPNKFFLGLFPLLPCLAR